jgi:hypothetical protein
VIERIGISGVVSVVMALFAGLGWFQAFTKDGTHIEAEVRQLEVDVAPVRQMATDIAVLKMQVGQCK